MQLLINRLVAPKAGRVPLGLDRALGHQQGRGRLPEHPMQRLEIMVVGQFHQPAELQFYCAEGRSSGGSPLTAGADVTAPLERAEAVRATRSVLYMQEFPFQLLASIMTTPIAFRGWYELPNSIDRRRHRAP